MGSCPVELIIEEKSHQGDINVVSSHLKLKTIVVLEAVQEPRIYVYWIYLHTVMMGSWPMLVHASLTNTSIATYTK